MTDPATLNIAMSFFLGLSGVFIGGFLTSCYWKAEIRSGWVFFDGKIYTVEEE